MERGPRDRLRRPLRDLRVSVTDRCNLRCRYCMPRELFGPDHAFLDREELLSFEEIARVVTAAATLGVTKIRLTGGEPLLRRDLHVLVGLVADVDGIADLALTSNGVLLPEQAPALATAGLRRVTVSLDALDDATFRAVADTPLPVERVLAGIAAADAAGLGPVKVNAVVRRGVNEHAVPELAAWGRDTGHEVRFIEFMDVGTTNGWERGEVVPAGEILDLLSRVSPVEPVVRAGDDPAVAESFRYLDTGQRVGVIASVTRPFCRTCVRARLSAVGELFTCLFATSGTDLRTLVRGGASIERIAAELVSIWEPRVDRYSAERAALRAAGARGEPVEMSYIGG